MAKLYKKTPDSSKPPGATYKGIVLYFFLSQKYPFSRTPSGTIDNDTNNAINA
jgi:hypothetical protein